MKIQGPIEVELKVSVTNGEGMNGVATIGCGIGRYTTEAELRERVEKFVQEEMPEGFRLMTKREYFDTICPPTYEEDDDGQMIPMRFAMPGGNDYDD